MPKKSDSLICYKKIKLGDGNKMNFFLDKHSTQEGTWGKLTLETGAAGNLPTTSVTTKFGKSAGSGSLNTSLLIS